MLGLTSRVSLLLKIRHIAKFCKKNTSSQASPRRVVTYTKSISCFFTPRQPKGVASYTVNVKFLKSYVEKIIIDPRVIDQFFSNYAYFSKYEEYHYEFQTGSGE